MSFVHHYEGQSVFVDLGGVVIGRVLDFYEAEALNRGENPFDSEIVNIVPADEPIHFFSGGKGGCPKNSDGDETEGNKLARSITDCTCMDCFAKRADSIRGWRWFAEHNKEDVELITRLFGEGFGRLYAGAAAPDDIPLFLVGRTTDIWVYNVTFVSGEDYAESTGGAHTVSPRELGENDSGWHIFGQVCEDYYEWVNDFVAWHSEYGIVAGNFEDEIVATSKEGFQHFWEHHEPEDWDYHDI